jgi:chromosome segregation ATPase
MKFDEDRKTQPKELDALDRLQAKVFNAPDALMDPAVAEELRPMTDEALEKLKAEINEWLRTHRDVNMRAHRQLELAAEAAERFESDLSQLVADQEKTKAMIEKVAADRDNSIAETFRQVNEAFVEILRELDPEAHGRLTLNAHAVSMDVGFGGQEHTLLTQLSGGQKTLLSLTLIFAIQRALPAPFYLFDEVDAALDEKYRGAVARLIHRYSQPGPNMAQVILTTFKPELLRNAEAFFEVSAHDGRSSVRHATEEEALALLAAAPEAEGAAEAEVPSDVPVPSDADDEDEAA